MLLQSVAAANGAESSLWLQMSVGSTAPVPSVEDCMMACETGEAAGQGLGFWT